MAPKISKADLLLALRAAETERDCWQQVALNPEADFSMRVEVPAHSAAYMTGDNAEIEHWTLHASHRMSGPVLQIEYPDGTRTVRFLMDYHPADCVYRRHALGKCQKFEVEFLKSASAVKPEAVTGHTSPLYLECTCPECG